MHSNKEQEQQVITLPKELALRSRTLCFVLQDANLQEAKLRGKETLLSADEHRSFILGKLKQDLSNFRPDITHQCLLTLQDSPLNKLGQLRVYIVTRLNQVIEVNPATRIPRTYARFAPLFAQLLRRLKVRAEESSEVLLKVVKGPVSRYLPSGPRIALSTQGKKRSLAELVAGIEGDATFVVGAVSKGNPTMAVDFIEESVRLGDLALSANYCISKILHSFEAAQGL